MYLSKNNFSYRLAKISSVLWMVPVSVGVSCFSWYNWQLGVVTKAQAIIRIGLIFIRSQAILASSSCALLWGDGIFTRLPVLIPVWNLKQHTCLRKLNYTWKVTAFSASAFNDWQQKEKNNKDNYCLKALSLIHSLFSLPLACHLQKLQFCTGMYFGGNYLHRDYALCSNKSQQICHVNISKA